MHALIFKTLLPWKHRGLYLMTMDVFCMSNTNAFKKILLSLISTHGNYDNVKSRQRLWQINES